MTKGDNVAAPPDCSAAEQKSRAAIAVLVVVVIAAIGPLMHPLGDQAASRYALTAAIWDDHTIVLDGYVLGVDKAVYNQRTYSDKAPGQPYWAVPAYAIYRFLGGEPGRVPRAEDNIGLWVVTLWSSVLPAALLVVLMARTTDNSYSIGGVFAALVIWSGTLLLPMSSLLFGHILSSLFLLSSFIALKRSQSIAGAMVGGVTAGLAVVTEYTALLGVLVLTGWLAIRHGKRLASFLLGGLGPALALAAYNHAAFGSIFHLSYQYSAFTEVTDVARPIFAMFTPRGLRNIVELLFGGRGLLVATPIVAVAVGGLMGLARRDPHRRDLAIVGLFMVGLFLLLPMFWGNPWGGDSPGARYLAPALPFLVPGVVYAYERMRILTIGAAAISVATMLAATFTNPVGLSGRSPGGLGFWVDLALEGQWAPNLFGLWLQPVVAGLAYAILWAIALGGLVWLMSRVKERTVLIDGTTKRNLTL